MVGGIDHLRYCLHGHLLVMVDTIYRVFRGFLRVIKHGQDDQARKDE